MSAAIALGSNLPSAHGGALETLRAVRPELAALLRARFGLEPGEAGPRLVWSPLFRTAPVGGPRGQADYLNAVLLVRGLKSPGAAAAKALITELLALEHRFGRQRLERWGPRCLDLDLLWWGALQSDCPALQLPHPRLRERAFVLAPLAAIDPTLVPPAGHQQPHDGRTAQALLTALLPQLPEPPPARLAAQPGWPE